MKKLDKVITELGILRTWCAVNPDYGIGLSVEDCKKVVTWLDNALGLLKAQEQKPISASIVDSDGGLMHWWACGNCQAPINPEDRFCHECGRAVKWE